MSNENFHFNGLNGESGNYLLKPMTARQLSLIAQGRPLDEKEIKELKHKARSGKRKTLGPKNGFELSQAGWGVIFAEDDPEAEAVKARLKALLDHRREQASIKVESYFRELTYKCGEMKDDFLIRHGTGPGPADPEKLPYYLLIVGDPEKIPYRFQYQLDVQYAVGRIHFETLEQYENYARNVVETENHTTTPKPQATFFGVRNPDDSATQLSADELVKPLAESVARDNPGWDVRTVLHGEANKDRLGCLLGGTETPHFLFTASHGMGFPNGSSRQLSHQGALVCWEWPGPEVWRNKPIPSEFYFSADDVSSDARLDGLIAFHFACYGAGTPALNDFPQQEFRETREAIAPEAFVARLPQRLLGLPNGAQAVIGHIERAWGYSFTWANTRQLQVFEAALKQLMEGQPVGAALEVFNQRYAELSSDLKDMLEFDKVPDDLKLASAWTACNDARGYAIVGDPAVRLPAKIKQSDI
jgi:hypothetical protein